MQTQILKKLFFLLNSKERLLVIYLFIMAMVVAIFEVIGIASILPFLAILSSPEIIDTNALLSNVFQISTTFGLQTKSQFLLALGVLVFVLFIISIFFRALMVFLLLRFCNMREHSIGKRFIEGYLHQPYSWFLNRNSSDLGKNILSEVKAIIDSGVRPITTLISQTVVVVVLIILLIAVNLKIALIVGLSLSFIYGLLYQLVKAYLKNTGEERFMANQFRFKSVLEAFGAIKELKVSNLEQRYIKNFSKFSKIHAKHQASAQIISQLPRFILEGVAFGGLMLIILLLMRQNNNFNHILPILALYALAGYRLMPAMQQIYSSITQLRFIGPTLDKIYNDLKSLQVYHYQNNESLVNFKKSIDLENIDYIYPESSRTNLKNINISIKSNSTVGLVGLTGCGKTTTVDLILALLEPTKGTLKVDGKIINNDNRKAWQSLISYVPQEIYLADDTISSNIAFGADKKNIDQVAVERAAKIAQLHEFVTNELPGQYQTHVGERGVRLSGGQRQRIGIARALYHNPKLLIFDEATSALDNITENLVMETLYSLNKDITIIIIAHRLDTVKNCDNIFLLENGEIKSQGNYNELSQKNKKFQAIEKGKF